MNKEIGVFDKKKLNPRPCGYCGEDDTILFCCECTRKLREEDKQKRNVEVKQAITKRIKILKKEMKQYTEPEVNEFYARINELKKLLQKLGCVEDSGGKK